jgi:hypothetical protein
VSFCFPAADNARAGGMEGVVEGWRAWLTCCERAGLQHLETALALDPHSKVAQKNLGDALARKQVRCCLASSALYPQSSARPAFLPRANARAHAHARKTAGRRILQNIKSCGLSAPPPPPPPGAPAAVRARSHFDNPPDLIFWRIRMVFWSETRRLDVGQQGGRLACPTGLSSDCVGLMCAGLMCTGGHSARQDPSRKRSPS